MCKQTFLRSQCHNCELLWTTNLPYLTGLSLTVPPTMEQIENLQGLQRRPEALSVKHEELSSVASTSVKCQKHQCKMPGMAVCACIPAVGSRDGRITALVGSLTSGLVRDSVSKKCGGDGQTGHTMASSGLHTQWPPLAFTHSGLLWPPHTMASSGLHTQWPPHTMVFSCM